MREIKLTKFCAILSIVNLVCFNIPFLRYAWDNADNSWYLCACLAVLLLVLNFWACYLVCFLLRRFGRVLAALCHFISTGCVYYIFAYNVMMDESMIGNFFNTRYEEASQFITFPFIACLLIVGVLPMVWIIGAKVRYGSWKRLGITTAASLGAALLIILGNLNQTLWIGNHDTELGGLVMPWSYVVNTCRLFGHQHERNREETPLPDASFSNNERRAVVLVIGESARKANCSLYGYERDTNPLLGAMDDLHVINAVSNATYTTAGVKSILEYKDTDELFEILPNYAYRNGVMVQWRTSNWGEPPVHVPEYLTEEDLAARYPDEGDGYDGVLLNGLRQTIEEAEQDKVLIILHTNTSHGPAYCNRYPKRFEVYTPVCDNVEQASKAPQELINAYDNTIIYTDYLLNSIIDTLKTVSDRSCAMFYISDHGESLGENNLYMHGVPVKVAPAEQYEIPCYVWLTPGYREVKNPELIDQHWVFHSIMDLLDMQSPVFDPEKDLFR